jgi:HK97 family phage major capsid protein
MDPIVELAPEMKAVRDEVMSAISAYKETANKQLEELKKNGVADPETKSALDKIVARMDDLETNWRRPGTPAMLSKTVGAVFCDSPEVASFVKRGWHKGGVGVKMSDGFYPVPKAGELEQKTTIDSSAVGSSTPGILVPSRVPGIIGPGLRPLRMRDLLTTRRTSNNAVEFVKENVFTNAASFQTEAVAKAESALTFTIDSAPVRTIAHWIPATRQVLDDFVELMTYIDTRLMYGLKQKEDLEILTGDGLGVHLSGLNVEATAYAGTYNAGSDTKIDRLRHAILEINAGTDEFPVDGIVLHPADWEDIELVKTEEGGVNKGSYIMGGPKGMAAPTIWNKPVVETTAMPSGKFLVGSFQLGAVLWDRMDATIDVSTEHSDYFTKNMVAIRAEERLALAVYRPTAFRYGSF